MSDFLVARATATTWVPALVLVLAVSGCGGTASSGITCEREGAVLEEGLRVRDLRCGSGPIAERGMSLTVRYTLSVEAEDTVTTERGAPYTFRLGSGQVVPGWDAGLPGTAVGGTRELVVPPGLAYGDAGLYPDIPPDATVTFEVDLLELHDPE